MRTQAYHGGCKLSGVDVGKFMSQADKIIPEIEAYLIGLDHPLKEASNESISVFLDHIKRAAHMLDQILAILRKAYGTVTQEDLDDYEAAAEQLMTLWNILDLNSTPSIHYIHKEAIRLLRLHGGFTDLTEDHIEQSHQNMDRIHQRLGRLGFGAKRAMAISRLAQMSQDPTLRQQVAQVRENMKRKRKRRAIQRTNECCCEKESKSRDSNEISPSRGGYYRGPESQT
jgi:hypothetical protein